MSRESLKVRRIVGKKQRERETDRGRERKRERINAREERREKRERVGPTIGSADSRLSSSANLLRGL